MVLLSVNGIQLRYQAKNMNIALIIAGGAGNRMGQDIPKQFMHVDGAPIIIHTMKAFEQHPDIDAIAVVCLKGWETVLQAYANQFNITKLKWIFPGGSSGMESIHNGIYGLQEAGCDDEDLVLIHDAVIHKIVTLFGKMILDHDSHMYYRQHSANQIGIGGSTSDSSITEGD